jgi:hypothetical protein
LDDSAELHVGEGGFDDMAQDSLGVVHEAVGQRVDSDRCGFPPDIFHPEAQELGGHAGCLSGDRPWHPTSLQDRPSEGRLEFAQEPVIHFDELQEVVSHGKDVPVREEDPRGERAFSQAQPVRSRSDARAEGSFVLLGGQGGVYVEAQAEDRVVGAHSAYRVG